MFRILAVAGNEYIVGTHTGKVGVISRDVFQDEGLLEAKDIRVKQIPIRRTVWRVAHMRYQPISQVYATTAPSKLAIAPDFEDVPIKPFGWNYTLINAGYSERARTWYVWQLTGDVAGE